MTLHRRSVLLSRSAAAAVVAAWLAALTSATIAADVSPWDDDLQSAARLVGARASNDGGRTLRAGVEIKLKPGWKTYWRHPGDSGHRGLHAAVALWEQATELVDRVDGIQPYRAGVGANPGPGIHSLRPGRQVVVLEGGEQVGPDPGLGRDLVK